MCGIAGFSGDFPEDLLGRMNAAQAHRGPDGAGTYHDPEHGIGLAHLRLAILDLTDAGLQPMWSDDGRVAIIFNGEIYNFLELRAELIRQGDSFRSECDTEVLLALYQRHGPEMLTMLNGMFALAIWDRDEQELLLARDRYGVKPLYHAQTAKGLLFASELKTLLTDPDVSREIDPHALSLLLTYIWTPGTITPLLHVRKLEAGCAMVVRRGRIARSWRYASLPASPDTAPKPAAETEARLRALLEQAVRRQLIADVPVGAFLSGGLDSSAVVAYASKAYSQGRMQCFTLGSSETDKGFVADLPYARKAAAALDVGLTEVAIEEDWFRDIPALMMRMDEPIADPAVMNVVQICAKAKAGGMKVLLSGAGGDDLFSGYRRHVALAMEGKWGWAPRPLRAAVSAVARQLPKKTAILRRVRKALEHAHLSPDERLIAYFFWTAPARMRALTGSDYDPATPLRDALKDIPAATPPLEKLLYLEKRFFLVDHNLNYTDKAAMSQSVEVRVPFLDPDLVDFAATIHPSLKVRGREPKWIFKKAMQGVLPDEVIWRPKTGFGGPVAKWLRGPLRPWLKEQLASDALDGQIDRREVKTLLGELDAGADDAAWTLFVIASFSAWRQSIA